MSWRLFIISQDAAEAFWRRSVRTLDVTEYGTSFGAERPCALAFGVVCPNWTSICMSAAGLPGDAVHADGSHLKIVQVARILTQVWSSGVIEVGFR